MSANCWTTYLKSIRSNLVAGNATEHTHRPALKTLVEALQSNVTAINEPKREKCGAPDFIVMRQANSMSLPLGYIEAKDVGVPLPAIEQSDQIKRYRQALSNLIVTDYLDFRW